MQHERNKIRTETTTGLSAYDTCSTCSEWVKKVATALGMYYDYDGPFVAAESDAVVAHIKELQDRAERSA